MPKFDLSIASIRPLLLFQFLSFLLFLFSLSLIGRFAFRRKRKRARATGFARLGVWSPGSLPHAGQPIQRYRLSTQRPGTGCDKEKPHRLVA